MQRGGHHGACADPVRASGAGESRIHRRLIQEAPGLPGVTVQDVYEAYPTFDIDVGHEQALLLTHDVIVFQHPLFWYSTPALLKQWMDLVLEHG